MVRLLSEKEVDDFFKGRTITNNGRTMSEKETTELVNQLPYNNLYEIPEHNLQYCKYFLTKPQVSFPIKMK